MMRSYNLLCSLCLLLGAGCVTVHASTSPAVDLSRYHSFAFFPSGDFDNQQFGRSPVGQAIHREVAESLEKRGLVSTDVQPDFWVACYLVVEQRETAPYASPLGPLYWSAPGTIQYLRGTVVVDFIDPATRNVMWRGTARTPVSHPENPDPRKVATAVAALMRRHPPPLAANTTTARR